MATKTVQKTFRLPEDLEKHLLAIGRYEDRSFAQVVRRSCEDRVVEFKKSIPNAQKLLASA